MVRDVRVTPKFCVYSSPVCQLLADVQNSYSDKVSSAKYFMNSFRASAYHMLLKDVVEI